MIDGFLQTIPDCLPSSDHSIMQNESQRELKLHEEVSSVEDVSIFDGFYYKYSEYEDDVELCSQGRRLWDEVESSQYDKKSRIKILLVNLQLKDDSTNEMSEISTLDKVISS